MKIEKIILRSLWNSATRPALEVSMQGGGRRANAVLPTGESRGSREAAAFGYEKAQKVWPEIVRQLEGRKFGSVADLDRFLIALDGTSRKTRLGGNVILGLSLSFGRLLAGKEGVELWELLRSEFFPNERGAKPPLILANFIEGGAHAPAGPAFQEYLLVADTSSGARETVFRLAALYISLGVLLKKKYKNTGIGAEAGYAYSAKDEAEPLRILRDLIRVSGFKDLRLGIDCAGNHFFSAGKYALKGKKLSSSGLASLYKELFAKEPLLFYMEDPFSEKDAGSFPKLRSAFPERWISGDDLTVTNPALIRKAGRANALKAVIIKANQIGSLSEASAAIKAARKEGLNCVVSHRGEETEDSFLVHIARAANAEGLKMGPPARERIIKFNEFLRLYP